MKTSAAGIGLIKRNEGCRLTAYLDTIANPPRWTIGYGETGNYVYEGLRYTQDQADMGLARRLASEFEPGVMAALGGAPVTQAQFDALVSLEWNIGVGRVDDPETPQNERKGLKGSSVIRYHRAGDYQAAADAFRPWNKADGKVIPALVRRREEERALYLSAPPSPATRAFVPAAPDALQRELVALGYAITVDGRAGPATCGAALDAIKRAPQR